MHHPKAHVVKVTSEYLLDVSRFMSNVLIRRLVSIDEAELKDELRAPHPPTGF